MRKLFTTKLRIILVLALLLTAGLAILSSVSGQSLPDMVVQGFLAPFRAGASALTPPAEQFYS